jgi:hypothetical protein
MSFINSLGRFFASVFGLAQGKTERMADKMVASSADAIRSQFRKTKEDWTKDNEKRADYFKAYNHSEAGQKAKKQYYERNREVVIARAATRTNEAKQAYRNTWKDRNPLEVKASTKHRRDKHKQATPKWLSLEQKAEIRKIYIDAMTVSRVTKTPYVVDHIIPLRGQDVCGLHVPWNLQIMSREENLKKSNKHLAET